MKKLFVWMLLSLMLTNCGTPLACAEPAGSPNTDSAWKKRMAAKAEALMNASKKPVQQTPAKVAVAKSASANSKGLETAADRSKASAAKNDLKKNIKVKKGQKQSVSPKPAAPAFNAVQKQRWQDYSRNGIKNVSGSAIVNEAAKYKGIRYVFGGTTPNGFDCSGYVQYVFKRFNARLTRTADTQAKEGVFVTQRQLKPGDLVFFSTYEPGASHVGIYAGNGKFWSATSSRGIWLCGLQEDYWRTRYYGARRVLVANGEPN